MKIEIWSDIACPWCYIGKHRFESAIARFEGKDDVDVTYRAFQLDPGAPAAQEGALTELLARKYRVPYAQAQAMHAQMAAAGAEEGIAFDFERARPANTLAAHRLIHFAQEHGKQAEMKERLFRAYFTDGLVISDADVLVQLAAEVGLEEKLARDVVESGRYGSDVQVDQARARELGITGVPFFVVDEQYGVSGAQPADVLLEMLREVAKEAA